MKVDECRSRDYNDPDFGCVCPSVDRIYACPKYEQEPEIVVEINTLQEVDKSCD